MESELPDAVRAVAVRPEDLAALQLDLPDGEPREVHRVAGLLVIATALFRSSWAEEIDMSAARAGAMRREEPNPGETVATGDAVLLDTVNARRCMLCGGTGISSAAGFRHVDGFVIAACGEGPCADCDATGELVTAKVKVVSDQQTALRDLFIPTELHDAPGMLSVERIIDGVIPPRPNEAFRCHDLRKVAEVSAYRGAQKQQDPTFFGWSFRDTIELGSNAVDTFLLGKGRVMHCDIRAYAWPLLWLRYERPSLRTVEVAIFKDTQGATRCIRSDDSIRRASTPG